MKYERYFAQLKVAIPLLMEAQNVPGLSISVTSKNELLFSEGFGYTDLSRNHKVTANTRFSLQSISKAYTAFGFMLAVDIGKVGLDDPLKKYVHSLSVKSRDGYDYSDKIIFRHLLKHRSGLAHEAPVGNNFSQGEFEDHIKSINETYLKFKPDSNYSYSNLGIDLVAYALQKIYDMTFEQFMEQHVFTPLDMKVSTYNQEEFISDVQSAIGHGKTALSKKPIPMLGAGGMYSSVGDMNKFVHCFLNGGVHLDRRIMNESILKMMVEEYPASESWRYNLGLEVGVFAGKTIANHNGGGYGFYCTQDILPYDGLGAVSLTNSVMHANLQQNIIRNMWSDFASLSDKNVVDSDHLPEEYSGFIGIYQAESDDETFKEAIIPRNGELYLGNQKLQRHSTSVFFTDSDDVIEFVCDKVVKINYVEYRKILCV